MRVVTATMTGLPVAGASVTLRWTLEAGQSGARRRERFGRDGIASAADEDEGGDGGDSGEQTLSTDNEGVATLEWRPPPTLRTAEIEGDTISIDLEWMGPTRERLTKSLRLPVAINEITISIEAPQRAQLPHLPFDL